MTKPLPHLEDMIRVDHAGEHGAVRIYDGQRAVFSKNQSKHKRILHLIDEMAQQEQAHLRYFDELIVKHDVRPTALSPFWHIAGFALGAATACMGEKAAMACTAAVEAEIDAHYGAQLATLENSTAPLEQSLASTITAFRADEAAHRQTALDEGAQNAPGFALLDKAIRAGCRVAIKLSQKI